jgi:PKD repeat protein
MDYITVLTEPVADFAYDQIDLSLIFTSLSDGADSWFWEFGDGGTSMQENPTHTYDLDGEYEVSLTVSNDCGEDNFTTTIEVFVPPVADFSYSTDVGCAPLVVQFLNESSDNVQAFEWLFPGGIPASSTQENPVVTYNNPGFMITLIVENIAGVDELHNNLIEVLAQPEGLDF